MKHREGYEVKVLIAVIAIGVLFAFLRIIIFAFMGFKVQCNYKSSRGLFYCVHIEKPLTEFIQNEFIKKE